MSDLKKCQKLWKEYFQEHNRKEKDTKAEEKLDELLTQAIKFSLQEGRSRNEGNKR